MQKLITQQSKAPLQAPLGSQRILVIDDNSDMLILQQTILEVEGYEVFTAAGGEEALSILSVIHPPSLILLDMQMEGMNGLEFLIQLEVRYPELMKTVPVVFLTAMDSVPKSRAVGFIRKPMDTTRFLDSIHRYIELGSNCGNLNTH